MKQFSIFNFQFSIQRGFTLIEILVVISMMSILMLSSIGVFFSYNRSQTFQAGISDFIARLNEAKSKAISQVKPDECGDESLQGYQVSIALSGRTYRLRVFCGVYPNSYIIGDKLLPASLSFTSDSSPNVYFNAGTGTVDPIRVIKITGNDKTKTVIVDEVGNISIE